MTARGGYALSLLLLLTAGWVDATAVRFCSGLFVSFMSGNTTSLGMAAGNLDGPGAWPLAFVLAAFVGGVIGGELVAACARRRHRPAVLAMVLILLLGATALARAGIADLRLALLLAASMGAQNAVLQIPAVALTFVTGTLVRFGRAAAACLSGRGGFGEAARSFGQWLAMVTGAALCIQIGALTQELVATCGLVAAAMVGSLLVRER